MPGISQWVIINIMVKIRGLDEYLYGLTLMTTQKEVQMSPLKCRLYSLNWSTYKIISPGRFKCVFSGYENIIPDYPAGCNRKLYSDVSIYIYIYINKELVINSYRID